MRTERGLPLRSASVGSAFHSTPGPVQVSQGMAQALCPGKDRREQVCDSCLCCYAASRQAGPELPGLLILDSSSQNLNIGDYKAGGGMGGRKRFIESLGLADADYYI